MMTLDDYLSAYSDSHQNRLNKTIHIVSIPLILFSLVGLLLCLPGKFFGMPFIYLPALVVGVYYYQLSLKYFLIFFPTLLIMMFINMLILRTGFLAPLSIFIFIASWGAQLYGHKIEGSKPRLMDDLQFALIGPIWVIKQFTKS